MSKIDKVFEFCYNDFIHESSAATISIHKTRKGAEMAMEFHKLEQYKKYIQAYPTKKEQKEFPFGTHEAWFVEETEIKE